MSDQAFRENVEEELGDLFDRELGDEYGPGVTMAFERILPMVTDWAVERFGEPCLGICRSSRVDARRQRRRDLSRWRSIHRRTPCQQS